MKCPARIALGLTTTPEVVCNQSRLLSLLTGAAYMKGGARRSTGFPTRGGTVGGSRTHKRLILNQDDMPILYDGMWGVQDTTCDVAVVSGLDFLPWCGWWDSNPRPTD